MTYMLFIYCKLSVSKSIFMFPWVIMFLLFLVEAPRQLPSLPPPREGGCTPSCNVEIEMFNSQALQSSVVGEPLPENLAGEGAKFF